MDIREAIDTLYRAESRRIFASLVRYLGDFDLAEEALHEAFTAAVVQWERDGVPANPRAWLVSAGRFKAIDSIRRRAKLDASLQAIAARAETLTHSTEQSAFASSGGSWSVADGLDGDGIEDDRLRLIFTCCHPSLAPHTQVALTLREVCGLTTEDIARAFLSTAPTIAQRIVRGKAKIRDAAIPYRVPSNEQLPERLESVLAVIYLVFNEGYSASSGAEVVRNELADEAIRLGRLLLELLSDAEVMGLLALMLLQQSRKNARTDASGQLILLEEQNRSLWDQGLIAEGLSLVDRSFATGDYGLYTIQAAIAAYHAKARTSAETDWTTILALYDALVEGTASPVVELNRAVAVMMTSGPEKGLEAVDGILARGELAQYHLAHATRADMCRRLGKTSEAIASYELALQYAKQEPERQFLNARLSSLRPSD